MKNKQKIVALIPARSGSRRVKNKNIRLLVSKPLIAYTIESALKCKSIDRVIVSTDSPLIAKIAKKYGAEVPFLRPASISKSHSTEYEFHSHLLDELSNKKYFPEYIVNLYPTCPLRTTLSIEKALKMIISNHPCIT
jgi:CMP-N-acetylneuraminic acid synthetase